MRTTVETDRDRECPGLAGRRRRRGPLGVGAPRHARRERRTGLAAVMPEMLQFCGRQMTVEKVAHKLCDTISATGMRRMERAVHLRAARCDGAAHGGCQTGCLLYWKEAWLKRVDGVAADVHVPSIEPRITLPLLQAKT